MRVIVTGASKGIGRGIATVLAGHGCRVGALARARDALDRLAGDIAERDGVCHARVCDVRDFAATQRAVAELTEVLGGLDALVNNAGLVIRKDVFEITLDEWHAMIDTNVTGLFHATRALLDVFKEQGHGHIVNVSSISGKFPLAGGSAYAATKFAVTGFSQSLFQEVRGFGIKVSTIYPGSVDSASHRHGLEEDVSWKVRPEEVGEACWGVLNTRAGNVLSEVEIRPLARPPQD